VLPVFKKEIHAEFFFHDLYTLFVGVMLQYYLFKEIKSFLVVDVLSKLYHGPPSVRGELFLTIFTLLVMFCKFHHKALLQIYIFDYLLLNR
jgi:hypothetical protein